MKTIHDVKRYRVPQSALSLALLLSSAVWLVSACAYYATSAVKHDWSATPLFWMLIVLVSPAISFAIGLILVDARKHSAFTRLEWVALITGLLPVSLGTLLAMWAVRVLLSMSGVC